MVFYNASGALPCLALPDDSDYDGVWNYQWCTQVPRRPRRRSLRRCAR